MVVSKLSAVNQMGDVENNTVYIIEPHNRAIFCRLQHGHGKCYIDWILNEIVLDRLANRTY